MHSDSSHVNSMTQTDTSHRRVEQADEHDDYDPGACWLL